MALTYGTKTGHYEIVGSLGTADMSARGPSRRAVHVGSDGTSAGRRHVGRRRFLMVQNSDDFPIVIVQNWPQELGRLVR
jgi:hypothetical protein